MNNYLTVVKALFKNKFRFGESATRAKKIGFIALIALAYALILAVAIMFLVMYRNLLANPVLSMTYCFIALFSIALVVLFFGIVHLVSTLYLSKDTDFYSMLPIKASTVFAAKLTFVYLSEAIITIAVMLPLVITFGILSNMWAGFYLILIPSLLIVPALPLMLAAIIAIPVMFVASKLKNRSVVALIFYIVLFGGFFGAYMYFVSAMPNLAESFDEQAVLDLANAIQTILYVLYPYTALTAAACGVPMYGLDLAASNAANIAIFVGISAVLAVIILLCAKFMYSQSAKANNQTDNSKAAKGEFKQSSVIASLMKREFKGAFRTTQVAFQCFGVCVLPIIVSVIMGVMINNSVNMVGEDAVFLSPQTLAVLTEYIAGLIFAIATGMIAMIIPCVSNGAATSFSREGSALATLKVLPLTARQVVLGKVCAWLCVSMPVSLISAIVYSAMHFEVVNFLLSVISMPLLTAVITTFGALWDLSAPKVKWTDPVQAVKHNGHVTIGLFICMAGGAVAFIAVLIAANAFDFTTGGMAVLCYLIILAEIIVFAVVDFFMLRNAERNYNRIEI